MSVGDGELIPSRIVEVLLVIMITGLWLTIASNWTLAAWETPVCKIGPQAMFDRIAELK